MREKTSLRKKNNVDIANHYVQIDAVIRKGFSEYLHHQNHRNISG